MTAFSQHGLVIKHHGQIGKTGFILFSVQLGHQRVLGVNFKDTLVTRHFLTSRFQDATHLHTHLVLIDHQARW